MTTTKVKKQVLVFEVMPKTREEAPAPSSPSGNGSGDEAGPEERGHDAEQLSPRKLRRLEYARGIGDGREYTEKNIQG